MVVPVGKGDEAWRQLMPDFAILGSDDEVIIVTPEKLREEFLRMAQAHQLKCKVHWAPSRLGRGSQMNTGERWATTEYVWFLHADSRLPAGAIARLKASIASAPDDVHFFDLKFLEDGPLFTVLNEAGAWIRSRIFRLPFGDQGLCFQRNQFRLLGGFNESTCYGEDHLLVWTAHRNGIRLKCVGAHLFTSARKYTKDGWAITTLLHLALTIKQAAPEVLRCVGMGRRA